jgi:hypothetical protein
MEIMGYSELRRHFLRDYKRAIKRFPNENALKIALVLFYKAEYFASDNKPRGKNLLLQAIELVYFIATDGMLEEWFEKANVSFKANESNSSKKSKRGD